MPFVGKVEFDGDWNEAWETLRNELSGHVREALDVTVEYAKEESPWITGTNKRSIAGDYFEDGQRVAVVRGEGEDGGNEGAPENGFRVYTQSGYGGYLEMGTTKMAAQPHIYPGFERAVAHLKDKLEGAV